MKKIFILFFFVSLLFPQRIFAAGVVINEFLVDPDSSQWVELYNKGEASIDVSGWFIDDDGGTQKFTIPAGTIINTNEFKVFESSLFNLDRTSADTIKLINNSIVEDSYNYNVVSGINNSYGRKTDGVGEWVIFSTPTKGSSNNNEIPIPSSTPMPSPTEKPTNTPTPTKTPTPTPTSKPTSTPSKTPTPTKAPTSTNSPTPTLVVNSNKSPAVSSTPAKSTTKTQNNDPEPTSILGESTENITNEASLSANTTNNSETSGSIFSKIIIALGVVFMSVSGILAFRIYKGKEIIPKFLWPKK